MKKFLCLALAASLLISCKKDNRTCDAMPAEKVQLDNAVVISKGTLVFASANETGLAKIYQQANNRYVVALEDMEYKTVFDLAVYLSKTPVYSSGNSLKLYSVSNFDNNIYYLLQAGVAANNYKYLIIQKPAATEPIATAVLQ